MNNSNKIQLSKAISLSGFCSRKKAELLIKNREVIVDNEIINFPSHLVCNTQKINIKGKFIQFDHKVEREVWGFHKVSEVLTTHSDPGGRKTIFDFMPKKMINYMTIGRLDFNSEGLILLTNDGDFAREMELPINQIERVYRVKVFGSISNKLFHINNGIKIDGICYKPKKIELIEQKNFNSILEITLTEGKNREIRNIIKYFNLRIKSLKRIQYGDYRLNNLLQNRLILFS